MMASTDVMGLLDRDRIPYQIDRTYARDSSKGTINIKRPVYVSYRPYAPNTKPECPKLEIQSQAQVLLH